MYTKKLISDFDNILKKFKNQVKNSKVPGPEYIE